jgi:tetratricopeptide (TPR) repeat protein
MSDFLKVVLSGIGVLLTSVLLFYFSGCSTIDFSRLKYSMNPHVLSEAAKAKKEQNGKALQALRAEIDAAESRDKATREHRAKLYVKTAVRDYYNGSADEALERLSRAQQYDPGSYEALRLSGQILYEQNQLRKAYNDWSRATQLPNDDKSIPRDLDVLKQLLRYCRYEKDRLQAKVNRHPEDRIATARLKELENMMRD